MLGLVVIRSAILAIATVLLSSCQNAETVELNGVRFSDHRQDRSGTHIGRLAGASTFDGATCAPGWAHFYPDWRLRACTLAEPLALYDYHVPSASWIVFGEQGSVVVAFERDTQCHEYVCRGTGGATGVQTEFYSSGRLRAFFPRDATRIDGILCAADLSAPIELYETGNLLRCKLAEATYHSSNLALATSP
jgi:hypothetical protein